MDQRNASQNQDQVYQGGGVCIDCQVGGAVARSVVRVSGRQGLHKAGGSGFLDSVALFHRSITPQASTVSSVCLASTAPQTTHSTHPMPAAVSGGDRVWLGWGCPKGVQEQGMPRWGVLGPLQLSGRPWLSSHIPGWGVAVQMLTLLGGLRALGLGSPDFPHPLRLQL